MAATWLMNGRFKRAIDTGAVDDVRSLLKANPALASSRISWGAALCPCRSEPLHYLSDAPFHRLWNHGQQAALAEALIAAGAPVDGLPDSAETPLHGAASLGEVSVADVLIRHGASLEAVAHYPGIPDGTPLDFAVHFGMVEVVDLLVSRGAKVLSPAMAAGAGQLQTIRRELPLLVENIAQLADVFFCATICDRQPIVESLLSTGVDIHMELRGATALHWAAWEGKPGMVRFLLSYGASPDRRDSEHQLTAEGWARHRSGQAGAVEDHAEVIQILAAAG